MQGGAPAKATLHARTGQEAPTCALANAAVVCTRDGHVAPPGRRVLFRAALAPGGSYRPAQENQYDQESARLDLLQPLPVARHLHARAAGGERARGGDVKAAPKFDCGHTDADVPTLLGEICYRCHGCGKNVTRAALDRGLAVLNMPALAARIDRLEAALKAAGIALLLVGCSGHATSEPSCTLEGDYTVTVEGCGHTSTQVRSQSWTAPCRDGDQCEPGEPSAFCAFVSEQACGDVWTTFERVEAVAAVAPEVCVLEGDYTITNLPDPGCGYEQTFPARVTRREVACTSEEQTCTPGSPSPLCVITKRLSETCAVRSVWELAL